ncbi:hypothetical protein SEA_MADAMATO_45 [Streptomyces phage Madamato]|nr:hypothetical protein SEA_MADAMATO_45 [Streptomyces phage Madamato]
MSETTPSKKSFLTRAMEAVEAKKAAKITNEIDATSEEAAAKKALKKFAVVTAGTIAATVAIIVVANKFGNEEETEIEQETPDTDENPIEN